MKPERLKEGWVEFIRYYCKEGFIDYWSGDMAHNPNKETTSLIVLNAFAFYYRLNGEGEWVHYNKFNPNITISLINDRSERTAEEIWNMFIRK